MGHRMNRMQELREKMGLSQTEVANKLSISKSTYWDYEKSKREPNYEILIQIADFFQVPLDYLLRRELPETGCVISPDELEMLKKYQSLSPRRKKLINLVLDFEFQDSQNFKQNNSEIAMERNLVLVRKASRNGNSVREELLTEEQLQEIENLEPLSNL